MPTHETPRRIGRVLAVLVLGLCLFWPVATFADYVVPNLNVKVPGLTLASKITVKDGKVNLPWLSQYISAWQNYIIGISVVAAAIMIVYGGFLYILGTDVGTIKRGNEVIKDALVGLFLVFGSYMIMSLVTGDFNSKMTAQVIQQVVGEKAPLVAFSVNDYKQLTKKSKEPGSAGTTPSGAAGDYNPSECTFKQNAVGIPTLESMVDCAITISNKFGINPCYAIVAMNYETGGLALPNIIGHDEDNYAVGNINGFLTSDPINRDLLYFWVDAGRKYLESGKKFKEATFSPCSQTCGPKQCNTPEDLKASVQNYKSCMDTAGRNNDRPIDPSKPDLGLDWRFSHGIGPGQATIFKNWCQKDQPSVSIKGVCFTVKQLVDPYGGLYAMLWILKSDGAGNPGDPNKVWAAYAGSASAQSSARAAATTACNPKNPIMSLKANAFTICRGDYGLDRSACQDISDQREKNNKGATPDTQQKTIHCRETCGSIGVLSSLGIKGASCDPKAKSCPLLTIPK